MSMFVNKILSLGQVVIGQVAPDVVPDIVPDIAPDAASILPAPVSTAPVPAAPVTTPTMTPPEAASSPDLAASPVAETSSQAASTAQPLIDSAAAPAMAPASVDGAASAMQDPLSAGADTLAAPDAAAQGALDMAAAGLQAGADTPGVAEAADASMGFMHFIAQGDVVGKTLFAILIVMSLISWYLIVVKTLSNTWRKRRSMSFLNRFWKSSSLEQVEKETISQHGSDPYSHLTLHAIEARRYHAQYGATNLEAAGSNAEFVTRAMRKVIDEETAKMENGLTVLASVGSTAPFVGLFGTVWGVYHALVGIGLSDGVTINHIAGPVGEALIMTGLGLAVAIPAVLAYNALVRSNRVQLSQLDAFAHDLFAFLGTGQPVPVSEGRTRAMRRLGETASKRSA